jgi:hypothetical protein
MAMYNGRSTQNHHNKENVNDTNVQHVTAQECQKEDHS